MNNNRTILSLFLILIYVHSFAHGSLPHSSCDDHQSIGHLHQHEVTDIDDTKDYHCASKGLLHSFVHLIESLAHNQFAHDEPMVFEVNESKFVFLDVAYVLTFTEKPKVYINKWNSNYLKIERSSFYLFNPLLRGPPSLV